MDKQDVKIPLKEKLKSIPGIFGIHFTEKPKFNLLQRDGEFEIREYEPMLIAKVTVPGSYEGAREEAFKKLASYIFGENVGQKNVPMTSPVLQEGQAIQMTAPVISAIDSEQLTMSFVLPHDLTAQTAPLPLSTDIRIEMIPAQTWAVIEFSGKCAAADIEDKTTDLEVWLKSRGQNPAHEVVRVAQYDGPSTIPMLRRNEIQILLWSNESH